MNNIMEFSKLNSFIGIPRDVLEICIEQNDADTVKFGLFLFLNPDKAKVSKIKKSLALSDKKFNQILGFWLNKNIFCVDNDKIMYIVDNRTQTNTKVTEETASKAENDEKPEYNPVKYTAAEISLRTKKDKNVSVLLSQCENIKGSVLTRTDIETIMFMMDTLGFDVELILLIATHCASSLGKRNFRYIMSAAVSWHKSGIRTYDDGEKYLKQLEKTNTYENKVKKIFGLDRSLTENEKKYIRKWALEYKCSFEMIKKAYEVTIERINKIKFAYIDKILESWHTKGYKSPGDINEKKIKMFKKIRTMTLHIT